MTSGRQLQSLITSTGELRLSFAEVEIGEPGPDEVIVSVQAAPLNPSDLGLMLGPADISTASASGEGADRVITASVPERALSRLATRLDKSQPVGNEGAGIVVGAGSSDAAQALVGKTVAMIGGAMFGEYRLLNYRMCQELPAGTTAADGASWFVNPMTALAMVETMRRDGHTAIVFTAAASNLGQMLNRVCLEDGIGIVNIVRSEDQRRILEEIGAEYIVDSTTETFRADLTAAITATGATVAFDAIGGGTLASDILNSMEAALSADATEFSVYGTNVHKQVYIYGALNPGKTELARGFGFAWGVNGWLLAPTLAKLGTDQYRLRERVVNSLTTTFASNYTRQISLLDVLDPAVMASYSQQKTGEKYLVVPNLGE
ncbi:NADH oxidase [Gordonia sp. CPCC 205333]|uniref:NADH oxidase n=1 Tax=Gordonia sp. CPCC 205333 TaxID=3140790 RepID=UPI003AF3CCFC